ncbi:TonB-dependent receptor [Pedobacter sp. SD-b]|uniref:TonB-dependent receptor n=1 Tax=Pedobacter segetis TaxID=2793069 RepID=A0ABS1BMK0_9SPHI|nr:outer membrane beta-barrel family protein [Pedobacter segetis]MBK0384119.1 TonB-dependent receptor [Pedobacter segetis]
MDKTFTNLRYLALTLLIVAFNTALAQIKPGSLSGKVMDLSHNESIPFVNISLFGGVDSTVAKSFQTDANGNFSIKNLSLGSYNIKFSFVGFQTKTISKIIIDENRFTINLGEIALDADSKMLNEVVIEYKKPIIEMQDDKIVYNIDQSIFSEGSVATDILKNVPMVTVDIDGKPSIAGKRNTRIFIDGKPSDYNASSIGDLLSILPSDALETIEVITDPSSKFDADGDGIINIVMKKGRKLGLTGNLSTRVGTMGDYNTGFFVSKKNDRFSFSSNAGFKHGVRYYDGSSNKTNIFNDTTYNNQDNNNNRISNGFDSRFGASYQIDSAQNLKFSFRGGYNNGDNESLSNNLYLDQDLIAQTLRRQNNLSNGKNLNLVADLDYTLKTKKLAQYAIGLNYQKNSNNSNRDYSRYLLNPDGSPITNDPSLQYNDNQDFGDNIDVNVDFDQGFNFLNSKLEAGIKGSFNFSDQSQAVKNYDYTLNDYVFNPALTNKFKFNQNVYSGYLSYRFKIKDWGFRLGNRAEITQVSFKQENAANLNIAPYLSLFPSIGINRSFNNKYSIGLNYGRRISRPRENALNPIIDDSDPQNIRYGNPALIPSFTNQYGLNFSIFTDKWSFSPRFSYAVSNKIIERIKTVNADGSSATTYKNLANSSALSFTVFGNYRASRKQTFNAGFTLSKVDYSSALNTRYNRNGYSIRSNIGINYSIKKSAAFEANINYFKSTAAQGTSNGSVETQFGFKQNLFKNKIGLRLTAVDPFSQKNITSITEGPNFYQESYSIQRTRNFLLSLSYRFTKIDKKDSGKKK